MAEPIANWMMSLNASTALETIADFAEQAEKTLDWIDQRAKSIDLAAGFKDSTRDILDSLKQIDMAMAGLGQKAGTLRFGIDTGKAESSLEDLARKTTDFKADAGPKPPEVYGPPRPPRPEPAPMYSEPIGPKQWDERRVKGMFEDLEQYQAKNTTNDLLATKQAASDVGDALDAAFNRAGRFHDLRNQLKGIDVAFHTSQISASMAQDAVSRVTEEATKRVERQQTAMRELRLASVGMFGTAAYMTRGLTQLGFADTGEEAVSQHYKQQLGRQFAGIAAPLKMENAGRVAELTEWFKRLNGEQQESIRSMALFTTTATTLGLTLPRLASALALTAGASSGVARFAGRMGGVVGLGAAFLASTPQGRDTLSDIAKSFEPVARTLLRAVQELQPAINKFAASTSQLIIPLSTWISQTINAGGIQGSMFGYLAAGRRGALVGGVAGQLADTIGGPGTVANNMPRTVTWGTAGGMMGGAPGAAAGAGAGALADWISPPGTLYRQQRLFGIWTGFMEKLSEAEARAATARGDVLYQSDPLIPGRYNEARGLPSVLNRPDRSDVTGMPGGFEAIERTWERITEAATRVDLQARQTQAAEQAVQILQEVANNTAPNASPMAGAFAGTMLNILGE